MSNVTTTTTIAPWILEYDEPAIVDVKADYVATQKRDSDGRYAPAFGATWLASDQRKATRLAARTFSSQDVELSSKYQVDADELFL